MENIKNNIHDNIRGRIREGTDGFFEPHIEITTWAFILNNTANNISRRIWLGVQRGIDAQTENGNGINQ